jgi:heme/copper-type cytochrome/quinol oxidase subunit 2
VFGVAVFVLSMVGWGPLYKHWLPENINEHGGVIDDLYYFIMYLTGVIFIGTGLAQFYFMWKFDSHRKTGPVAFTHGSHTLEVVWSILPAATLLFIAIYQMNAWADHKMRRPVFDAGPDLEEGTADDVYQQPLAEVTGRQFEWRIRYPGADLAGEEARQKLRDAAAAGGVLEGVDLADFAALRKTQQALQSELDQAGSSGEALDAATQKRLGQIRAVLPSLALAIDRGENAEKDFFTVNDLHVPVNEEIVLQIESADVLHSFFLPHLRVKQDVVPGMKQFVWFQPNRTGVYDIVCAELCGWGHYKMKGRLTVESREDYERWLKEQYAQQQSTQLPRPQTEEE